MAEPPDHAVGRSRGGLSTKIHALVDGHGLPLTIILTAGQRGDCPVLIPLLERLRVPRTVGRPRTQPDELRADKAYSSRAVRRYLREHRITATIPEKKNVIAARRRKGSKGGRPPSFDAESYKGRNVVERFFGNLKQWRGLAARFDKLALVYRAGVMAVAVMMWLRKLSDTL
ncbi:IS5 family transposase [Corynebacterium yudongzhengii]|uniref:IS5 family transposase n=1 Tax=Corynebacterium yudongzhengii TaxID=2080740 RepID=UPI001F1901AF|nr:IS5 family transposase [Corynebacterium yudongzhengii]